MSAVFQRRAFRAAVPFVAAMAILPAGAQQSAPVPVPPVEVSAPAVDPNRSLTVPTTTEATTEIRKTPGAVEVVPDSVLRTRKATTPKDILDYVPGVFVQPKWGEDSRLSIRGSGLSRNFHLRGVQLYMDGIPINTADGYGDFQEIAPGAYRYVEVFKGANALRFGANALGGAINFVTPSGRDAPTQGGITFGSFGTYQLQASSGAVSGPVDLFVAGTWQESDGYRKHSEGKSARGNANLGFRITDDIETRFYLNANHIRQRIPGEVDKGSALHQPRAPNPANTLLDWQRNVDSIRVANKTTMRFDGTTVEFGAFYVNRHLQHPIPVWLDWRYDDYGAFARVVDERRIGGMENRFVAGANVHNGRVDVKTYLNFPGAVKGPLLNRGRQDAENYTFYAENSLYVLPDIALVLGAQQLYAIRKEVGYEGLAPAPRARGSYAPFSPKGGLLWNVDKEWQAFLNVSRSAEVPSFGEGATVGFGTVKAQRATTVEIGTRGSRADYTWDVALYRSWISNELQCLAFVMGMCDVRNAPRTIHQGAEIGGGASVLKSLFVQGPNPDRLWLNLAYTFSDFHFRNDPTYGGNQIPGVPRHYLRAELLYKHPSGFFVGPNIEWAPQAYYVDNANTFKSASYVLFGLRAGYDDGGRLTAFVEARNLANRHYISSASIVDVYDPVATPNLFNPGDGRAVYAGLKVRW